VPDSAFSLPSRVRARLRQAAQLRDVSRREVVTSEGAAARSLFVVTSGALTATITSAEGRRAIVAMLSAGDVFGGDGLGAALRPSAPEVKAMLRSRLLVISSAGIEELMRRDLAVAVWLVRRLLEAERRSQHHTADLLAHGVPGRLEAMLRELGQRYGRWHPSGVRIALPLTQETLARLVGASRETVNRVLGELEYQDRIRRAGRSYVLPTGSLETRR
jgi:CRP/FNR family transcriptional regulator, cyclic AMP receptor protein